MSNNNNSSEKKYTVYFLTKPRNRGRDLFTQRIGVRVEERHKRFLDRDWDKDRFGEFSDYFRHLLDRLIKLEEEKGKNGILEYLEKEEFVKLEEVKG